MKSESAAPLSPRTPAEEKAFYDDMWTRYGHLEEASPAAFHRRRLVADIAARVAAPTARVLDVGCGQGELLRDLAARLPQAHIAGADLSERSLRASRAQNPTFELFPLDISAPDFAVREGARLAAFDLVVCSEVLEHIPDDQQAARNLAALLAPHGVLIALRGRHRPPAPLRRRQPARLAGRRRPAGRIGPGVGLPLPQPVPRRRPGGLPFLGARGDVRRALDRVHCLQPGLEPALLSQPQKGRRTDDRRGSCRQLTARPHPSRPPSS
jgi:SAM-dependent methyltransferase